MKKYILLIYDINSPRLLSIGSFLKVIFIAASILFQSCSRNIYVTGQKKPIDLNSVVDSVEKQYEYAQKILDQTRKIPLHITGADLTLKVTTKVNAAGDLSVWLFKPSSKIVSNRQTSVVYHFSPPKPAAALSPEAEKANYELGNYIVEAAESFYKLKSTIGTLKKESFEIDVVFAIEVDNSLSVSFKVLGLGADLSGEYDHAVEHDLKLTFNVSPRAGS